MWERRGKKKKRKEVGGREKKKRRKKKGIGKSSQGIPCESGVLMV